MESILVEFPSLRSALPCTARKLVSDPSDQLSCSRMALLKKSEGLVQNKNYEDSFLELPAIFKISPTDFNVPISLEDNPLSK